MKNFSSNSYASDHKAAFAAAMAKTGAKDDHLALLSDAQWFLYAAKDTVFYLTYSRVSYDKAAMRPIIANMTALAPQLTIGYRGARPGENLTDAEIDAITDVVLVDSFEGMPDKLLDRSRDLFERDDLPLFRVTAYVLKNGPDSKGRAALVHIRASHALLEGADSALLTRSQNAAHGIMEGSAKKASLLGTITGTIGAVLMTGMQLVLGHTVSPKVPKPWGFRTLAFERQRMRVLANRLGVRQRSVYFALVLTAMRDAFKGDKARVLYTLLDSDRSVTSDEYLRVSAQLASIPFNDDFVAFVQDVDRRTAGNDPGSMAAISKIMTRALGMQRWLSKRLPSWFGERFWSLGLGIDVGLTMVPPHHAAGALTRDVIEPIFCGAYHPGANAVAYCPGRRFITMSFTFEERLLPFIDRIPGILSEVEKRDIPALPATTTEAATA